MTSEAPDRLARALARDHPADAARVLERFDAPAGAALLADWGADTAAGVLEQMTAADAAERLAHLDAASARGVLERLDLDSAAVVLRQAEPALRDSLVGRLDPDDRDALTALLSSPANTAGSLLDPRVLAIPQDLSASAALERLQRAPRRALEYVYVVDRARRLTGVTSVRELLVAPADAVLAATMRTPVRRLRASDDRNAILAHPGWNEYHALPVVDAEGRFVGALRHETLRRLAAEPGRGARSGAAVSVAVSLGELYWLGLTGLLEGMGAVALRGPRKRDDDGA